MTKDTFNATSAGGLELFVKDITVRKSKSQRAGYAVVFGSFVEVFMQLYRSIPKGGGSGEDYSATYTATVNGVIQKGSCARKYQGNELFNSAVTIGNNVNMLLGMFQNCKNFGNDIYINGGYRELNTYSMFWSSGRTHRINVHFNNVLTPFFYDDPYNLFMGTLTWTNMTNGFYNTYWNIYCYNNYTG